MPAIVMAAFANDLNPAIDAQRRLIARRSCWWVGTSLEAVAHCGAALDLASSSVRICVIHAGPIRFDRGRRQDEKIMISGALTLLTNAVTAYNTWKLNQVLERRKQTGQSVPSDAILAHIAPIRWLAYAYPCQRFADTLTGDRA